MKYDSIRAALETRLASLEGVPQIVPENVRFVETEGQTYLQTVMVPIRTRIRSLRGTSRVQRYQGWFQIKVATPRFTGSGNSLSLIDQIAEHFEPGTSIPTGDGLHVTIEYCDVGNKSLQETHFSAILNVGWYLYA
jgi:hypothetical protein